MTSAVSGERKYVILVIFFIVILCLFHVRKTYIQKRQKLMNENSDVYDYDIEYDYLLNDKEYYSQQDIEEFHKIELLANTDHIKKTNITFSELASLYLPSAKTIVNADCRRDLDALNNAMINPLALLVNHTFWPLEMVDSWGKQEDGLLAGNVKYMGFFYECLLLDVDDQTYDAHFQGQYCTMAYGKLKNASEEHFHTPRMPIASLPIPSSIPLHILSYATCMPSTCTKEELVTSVNRYLAVTDRELTVTECQTLDQKPNFDTAETSGIIFFNLLKYDSDLLEGRFISIPQIVFYNECTNLVSRPLKYLLVFSISGNLKKIFHVDTKTGNKFITCIHGIRFLSICWVIIGHQWVFSVNFISNPIPTSQYLLKPFMFQIIANAFLSVDTFFFMSGLLVAYGFMNLTHKSDGRFNPLLYYVHRVVRLLPPILVTTAFVATLSGLMVDGPLSWEYKKNMLGSCRENWWHDPFFLTNIFQISGNVNLSKSCLGQCWYVAADMQMYIVMPLLLLPLVWWPKKGAVWLAAWTVISCLIPAIITAQYDLPPTILVGDTQGIAYKKFYEKIYVTPWARASPYLVGAWTGYLLYASSGIDSRVAFTPKLNWMQAIIGWVGALTGGFAVLFGMWRFNNGFDVPEMPRASAIIYAGFHRAVWAVMMGWIVCACHWGYGGPINWFLSHPLWQPLSRLTFSFYLVSLPIQYVLFYSTHKLTYFTNLNKVIETAGVLLISFFCAVILTLVSESPVMAIEKMLLKPQEKKETDKTVNDLETEDEGSIVKKVDLQRTFSEQQGNNSSFA
ncbi:unnamed protein product, partial [Meganyctiphanes norvegica]